MKKLSDYKGEDAIELWGDLLDPVIAIIGDKKVTDLIKNRDGHTMMQLAQKIVKWHSKEILHVFKTIDPDEEIDGLSVIMRLTNILAEIGTNAELRSFFGFAGQEIMENESTGSATENTEDGNN